jgi:hypothetical protein
LRDDAADQERDQEDDADRLPADAIEVMDDRGNPEIARPDDGAGKRHG